MRRLLGLMICLSLFALPIQAEESVAIQQSANAENLMQQFNAGVDDSESPERKISDKSKHEVLFWMGAGLLLGLLLTGGFGIAVGVLGKDLFIAHMVCAGLTITLGLAHAVTAFVWFWPYS
ncbi:MAG: hypothetical protein R8J84_06655 [Mariprofundales bacterium]